MNEGPGSNRKGTIYRRWQNKKYFDLNDSPSEGKGVLWLRYMVGGKTIEQSLQTSNISEARKKQSLIMRPLELASKKEVLLQTEVRLKQVDEALDEDREARHPPLKLTEAWPAYLSAQNRPRSGQRTLDGYASQFKKFREWMDTTFPNIVYMKAVGTHEAEAYAEHLTERKLSPSSYNQNLNTLTLIWAVLSEKGRIGQNPFAWDKKTRMGIHRRSIKTEAHERRKRPLTVKEIDELLKKAKGDYRTLIIILLCTGQRLVDGIKLEWKSIDFDKRVIKLVPQKTSKRTGKAVYIPLFPQLATELLKRKKTGRYVLPKLAAQYEHDSPSISKEIKEICIAAGIQTAKKTELKTGRVVTDVGAHSLRHTFVTIARMAGLPDPVICQITGHNSQEMVDHYTQFSEEMVAALAGKLLGTTGVKKALPAPSAKAAKEPIPDWAKAEIRQAINMLRKLDAGKDKKMKAAILKVLKDL
jgi:integrase